MMIVMSPQATDAQKDAVIEKVKGAGVHVVTIDGEMNFVIGAVGDPDAVIELGLEGLDGVDKVLPISRPYKLASNELTHHEPTVIDIAGRKIGGGATFCLIAGPCTVESREQTLSVARTVKAGGASLLRGGAFKPRTSPFAFRGLGEPAVALAGRDLSKLIAGKFRRRPGHGDEVVHRHQPVDAQATPNGCKIDGPATVEKFDARAARDASKAK